MAEVKLTHTDGRGGVRMVDVGDKPITARTATAEAWVRVSGELAEAIRRDVVAKGSVLETARLAGIAAAKRTDELIPLCHSLPLDSLDLTADLVDDRVHLVATARTSWRTGVEMEALTAASVAALTVIDMGKAVDPGMIIESIRLLEKTGGRRGTWRADANPTPRLRSNHSTPIEQVRTDAPHPVARSPLDPPIRAAVLTVSDRCSRGEAIDTAGPAVATLLRERLATTITDTACVADEPDSIADTLRAWIVDKTPPDLILTVGGTGFSPRDHTPEATAPLLDRPAPGLMELARYRCLAATPLGALSRGVAGIAGHSLIVNLPGSQRGATQVLDALADVLPHAVQILRSSDNRA